MDRCRWLGAVLPVLGLAACAGCGRPVLPGQQFKGPKAKTSSLEPVTSALPKQPFFEAGSKEAKVRIVAFFAIDDGHKPLMDLLKSLAQQYPGKVYVKYIDYRTEQGAAAFASAKMTVPGVMINLQKEYRIEAKPHPYDVDFSQDMGRYWTADDLKKAVAQEVQKIYTPEAGKR